MTSYTGEWQQILKTLNKEWFPGHYQINTKFLIAILDFKLQPFFQVTLYILLHLSCITKKKKELAYLFSRTITELMKSAISP